MRQAALRGFFAILLVCLSLAAQRFPPPGDLPGKPFFITTTWTIGGAGDWDYLSMDPTARRLFIAHGPAVQVVNVDTGAVAGTVRGFRQAHAIALDNSGEYGYVTDGPSGRIKVFDRSSLQSVADIPTGPSPRALALDPQSGLLFAICSGPVAGPPSSGSPNAGTARGANQKTRSTITVIDTQTRQALANLIVAGRLGFAQAGDGDVYVTVVNRNEIMRIDASGLGAFLRGMLGPTPASGQTDHQPLLLDWSDHPHPPPSAESRLQFFPVGPDCSDPLSLAVDSRDLRVFTACGNMKMVVNNTDTGSEVASLSIGPDAEAIAYDADRGLIFTANGGGDGSVTIIRRYVTDTYAVVQNLPTRKQARTLAIDPSTGNAYLVTALQGAELGPPPLNGIGTLKLKVVDSSFQVLVLGH